MKRSLNVLGILVLVAGIVLPALAHHRESMNSMTFTPVTGSASPDAEGKGVVNYVSGASGETDAESVWTAAFMFMGLVPYTQYTVAVRGAFGDPAAFYGICTFITNESGTGVCQNRFTGLQRLDVVQLRLGYENGTPVLQATRQETATGPGEIVSRGGCREEAGTTCEAPGRQ